MFISTRIGIVSATTVPPLRARVLARRDLVVVALRLLRVDR